MNDFYERVAELARSGTLPAALEHTFLQRGVLAVLLIAPLLGSLSGLVVARRLAFFSTALGQAALTGLTIGIVLGEPLNASYGGIFGFCLASALAMVYVKRRTRLPQDTLIGVFLALTLGLGICLLTAVTKRFNIHQIEAVMFGSLLTVTDADLALLLVLGALVLATLARSYNGLLLDSQSAELAAVAGFRTTCLDYLFVVLLTVAIVASLKIVGALLVEALVVVPAAAARNVGRSARGLVLGSIACALVAGLGGLALSSIVPVPTGGAVVLCLALLFFVSLPFARAHGSRAL